jgi:hypothetical protein
MTWDRQRTARLRATMAAMSSGPNGRWITSSAFQAALRLLAVRHGIDLYAAVDSKVASARARDRGRFAVSYDPSTADCLRAFRGARPPAHCISSGVARLWGAQAWDGRLAAEHNVDLLLPFLVCFAKAARPESLDGFVFRLCDGPESGDMPALSRHFARLLTCVAARDPSSTFAGEVMTPGWQFSFRGIRFLISVFSPLYRASHSRHSAQGTFVLLRPEISTGAQHAGSEGETRAGGCLLPRWQGDPEVAWWEYV